MNIFKKLFNLYQSWCQARWERTHESSIARLMAVASNSIERVL